MRSAFALFRKKIIAYLDKHLSAIPWALLVLSCVFAFVVTQKWVTGDFVEGIWPELLSTSVGVAILYYLDKRRDELSETEQLKEELLWQVRSRSTDIAISAIDRLRHKQWLLIGENSLLRGIDLGTTNAKWSEANLKTADLSGAKLYITNGASLIRAKIQQC